MLQLPNGLFNFCPHCGQKLSQRQEEGKPVRFCPSHGSFYPHVAASAGAVILREGNREVLLVKRRHEPYSGTWMFPAGFISYGEHPEETIRREVKEETGLEVESLKIIDIFQSEDDHRSPGHFAFFYTVSVKPGELINDGQENTDVAWHDLNNLPPIGFKNHQKVIATLIN